MPPVYEKRYGKTTPDLHIYGYDKTGHPVTNVRPPKNGLNPQVTALEHLLFDQHEVPGRDRGL